MCRRGELYWSPLLYTLAVVFLYREVLAGQQGFGWDTIESYWPDLVYFSDELSAGHWPHWNPFDRGGYPFAADPQPGIYYPVQWLCAGLGALFDTGWWLIQFKMLLHHVIAGVCLHAFLRHRGLPRVAASIGGLALIASTPWLIHKASNLLWPIAWTPLLWIATDRLLQAPSARRAAVLALAISLAGSAGSPPGFFYVLLMAVSYGLFRAIQTLVPRWRAGTLWPYAGELGAALVAAALLSLALLWVAVAPALELSQYSPREHRDLAYALSMPLAMWPTLKALIVPTAGQVDAYAGILVMLLAACALALRPKRDGGAPIFFALAACFFLTLSFGDQLPVLQTLVRHVPGFGLFRISSRYKCLFAPMLAVTAGYGASTLLEVAGARAKDRKLLMGVSLVALALVGYLLYANPLDKALLERFPSAATPLVLTLLAIALILAAGLRNRRVAGYALALMPILVLSDTPRYWHHQELFLEKKVDHHEDLAKIKDLEGVRDLQFRIFDEFVLGQRPGSRLHIRDFRGYPSGDPLDFRRYRDVLARASRDPQLLEAYNVRYVLHGNHHRSRSASQRLKFAPAARSPQHFVHRHDFLHEALHPAALLAWYGSIEVVPSAQVLDAVLQSEDAQGGRQRAVLEEQDDFDVLALDKELAAQGPPLASVAGTILSFEADRVVGEIHAPRAGVVVLNEVGYPGWSVRVDGTTRPTLTANYLLRAVAVEAGAHRIEWNFQPVGHGARIAMYRLGLLALLLALLDTRGLLAGLRRRLRR